MLGANCALSMTDVNFSCIKTEMWERIWNCDFFWVCAQWAADECGEQLSVSRTFPRLVWVCKCRMDVTHSMKHNDATLYLRCKDQCVCLDQLWALIWWASTPMAVWFRSDEGRKSWCVKVKESSKEKRFLTSMHIWRHAHISASLTEFGRANASSCSCRFHMVNHMQHLSRKPSDLQQQHDSYKKEGHWEISMSSHTFVQVRKVLIHCAPSSLHTGSIRVCCRESKACGLYLKLMIQSGSVFSVCVFVLRLWPLRWIYWEVLSVWRWSMPLLSEELNENTSVCSVNTIPMFDAAIQVNNLSTD